MKYRRTPLFVLYSADNTQKFRSFWASLSNTRTPELFANVGNICWWKICLSSCKTLQNLAFSIFYVSLLRILAPFSIHFMFQNYFLYFNQFSTLCTKEISYCLHRDIIPIFCIVFTDVVISDERESYSTSPSVVNHNLMVAACPKNISINYFTFLHGIGENETSKNQRWNTLWTFLKDSLQNSHKTVVFICCRLPDPTF